MQEPEEPEEGLEVDLTAGTFKLDGVTFRPGDTVFVMPDTFDQCAAAIEDTRNAIPDFAAKSRHVKVGILQGRAVCTQCDFAAKSPHVKMGNSTGALSTVCARCYALSLRAARSAADQHMC